MLMSKFGKIFLSLICYITETSKLYTFGDDVFLSKQVAISISGFVISICSIIICSLKLPSPNTHCFVLFLCRLLTHASSFCKPNLKVFVGRSTAFPMLRHFCSDNEAETPLVFEEINSIRVAIALQIPSACKTFSANKNRTSYI